MRYRLFLWHDPFWRYLMSRLKVSQVGIYVCKFVYEHLRLALFLPRTQFHCRQSWICFKLNKITKRSWQRLGMEILPTKDTQKQGEDFKESKSVDPPPYEESNISLWVESLWELKNKLRLAFLYLFLTSWNLFLPSYSKKNFMPSFRLSVQISPEMNSICSA
jgi:hypothetical protein